MKILTILASAAAGSIITLLAIARLRNRPRVVFAEFETFQFTIKGDLKMFEVKEGKKARIRVKLLTAHGHPAAVQQGTARFTSSNPSVISVVQDPADELVAEVEGLDGSENESATIEFRADADRGEGVREIIGVVTGVCTQGDAQVVELVVTLDEAAPAAGDDQGGPVDGNGIGGDENGGPSADDAEAQDGAAAGNTENGDVVEGNAGNGEDDGSGIPPNGGDTPGAVTQPGEGSEGGPAQGDDIAPGDTTAGGGSAVDDPNRF